MGTLAAPLGSAGAGKSAAGGMTLIKKIALAGLSTADFTAIPQTYQHLKIVGALNSAQAANTDILTTWFNGVSAGGHYCVLGTSEVPGGVPSASGGTNMNTLGLQGGGSATIPATNYASTQAAFEAVIPDYSTVTFSPVMMWTLGWMVNAGPAGTEGRGTGVYDVGGVAISRITFALFSGGNFQGGHLSLYGLS